jgi:hypothetical protein
MSRSKIVQEYHEKCGSLGMMREIKIVRYPVINTPIHILIRWECQKCHDTFETTIPYLEALEF